MSPIRIASSLAFFFVLFAVQESAISLIHFPVAGFSLYLAVAIALIAYEDHDGAIIMGFLSGIVLDLSQTSNGPFGQWALILTLIGYVFASNRESIFDATSAPLTFVLLIALSFVENALRSFGRIIVSILASVDVSIDLKEFAFTTSPESFTFLPVTLIVV